MAILRQYIAPLIVVLIFLVSLVAVSARIFLPQDMVAPAPIESSDKAAQIPDLNAVAALLETQPEIQPEIQSESRKPDASRLDRLVKGSPLLDDAFAPLLAPQL